MYFIYEVQVIYWGNEETLVIPAHNDEDAERIALNQFGVTEVLFVIPTNCQIIAPKFGKQHNYDEISYINNVIQVDFISKKKVA